MNTKRVLAVLVLVVLALGLLAGGLGLWMGRAQAPRVTPASPVVASTPTQEVIPASASISGRVWHDICAVAGGEGGTLARPSAGCVPDGHGGYWANGLLDTAEPGIGGVLVQLGAGPCPAAGLASTTSDTSGAFAFTGLRAGTYCVAVDALMAQNVTLLPGSWTFPVVNNGSSVAGYTINLLADERRPDVNFGWDYQFLPQPEPVPPEPTLVPPEPTQVPPKPTSATCTDRMSLVRDVTIPDNTVLPPGQTFVKTWRLRNDGTCTWTTGYALVFVGGDSLSGPAAVPLPAPVAPGNTVDLSVTLTAPAANGTYEGRWRLRNASGGLFGPGSKAAGTFWVRIVVGPTPAPASPVTGWRGEYFNNRSLSGAPVLVRDDAAVNFGWGTGSPAVALPVDGFSARWTRAVSFGGGTYRFYARADDGVRVWLDGVLIFDEWHDATGTTYAVERTVGAGSHALRVEYYERAGNALIQFWWEQLTAYPDWRGEYWSNRRLDGSPTLVRNDANVDFAWGQGSPAAGVPADDFSARWTRSVEFDKATYRFYVLVDDGARLWVDGQLILDTWSDGGAREVTAERALTRGPHSLRVEYYEHTGEARVRVWWKKLSSPSYPDWRAEYWSNRRLKGKPALVRNDEAIDFDWGQKAAAAGLPADDFSVRWSRQVKFDAGVYRLNAWTDDGIRVYVDDNLVIDEWHESKGDEVYTVELALRDKRRLVVEYYERGGDARVRFWWKRIGAWPTPTPLPPTPTPLPPTPTPLPPTPTPLPPTPTPLPPTPTPLPPTPDPAAVRLNEVLPVPAAEGAPGDVDEWIEIYNAGPVDVDLSGWFVDDGVGGSAPYEVPEGTMLRSGAFALFYGRDTGVVLDDGGDEVRLLGPDGAMVDAVAFGALAPGASYSRGEDGTWHADWMPSPGAPNLPPVAGQSQPLSEPGAVAGHYDPRSERFPGDGS